MSSNRNFHKSQRQGLRNNEYYTRKIDIENELVHYPGAFKGKVVYCNCDDPTVSEFFRFFSENFEELGLKRLLTSCYKNDDANLFSKGDEGVRAVWLEYNGDQDGDKQVRLEEIKVRQWKGDGDFRKEESRSLLKQADIVVTNPPFGPFYHEFVDLMFEYRKDFIIIGNYNSVAYKGIFDRIQSGRMRLGASKRGMMFDTTEGPKSINSMWFTTLAHTGEIERKRVEPSALYDETKYPKYRNYDAIEVPFLDDIPVDYNGVMGVPITYLEKERKDLFEIVDIYYSGNRRAIRQDGSIVPARFAIRRRHPATPEELSSAKWKRDNPKPVKTTKERLKAALIKQFGRVCQCCGEEKTNNTDIHFDHVHPESLGGETTMGNGGLLCARCNIKKRDRVITYAELRKEGREKGWIAAHQPTEKEGVMV